MANFLLQQFDRRTGLLVADGGILAGVGQPLGASVAMVRLPTFSRRNSAASASNGIEDKMDEVVFGDPLPYVGWQQQWRGAVNVDESGGHTRQTPLLAQRSENLIAESPTDS